MRLLSWRRRGCMRLLLGASCRNSPHGNCGFIRRQARDEVELSERNDIPPQRRRRYRAGFAGLANNRRIRRPGNAECVIRDRNKSKRLPFLRSRFALRLAGTTSLFRPLLPPQRLNSRLGAPSSRDVRGFLRLWR